MRQVRSFYNPSSGWWITDASKAGYHLLRKPANDTIAQGELVPTVVVQLLLPVLLTFWSLLQLSYHRDPCLRCSVTFRARNSPQVFSANYNPPLVRCLSPTVIPMPTKPLAPSIPHERSRVAALGEHLAQAVEDVGRGRVLHIAHSGGALITYLAAQHHLTKR